MHPCRCREGRSGGAGRGRRTRRSGRCWFSSSRACSPVGSLTWPISGAAWARRPRARCSMLLTAAVVVPSMAATSAASKARTSRRMSTARCRAGRYCSAAISARRRLSRETAASAGSSGCGRISASGIGWSQAAPGPAAAGAACGAWPGAPSPDGSARLPRCSSAVRQRWWRSGTARTSVTNGLRTRRRLARPAGRSPGRGLRPRPPSRAAGSSGRAVHAGTAQPGRRSPACRARSLPPVTSSSPLPAVRRIPQ